MLLIINRHFVLLLCGVLEGIDAFDSGRDLFVLIPTGYGKSVIYAISCHFCLISFEVFDVKVSTLNWFIFYRY